MRYMLMFVDRMGVNAEAQDADLREIHGRCGRWYGRLREQGKLVEGHELKPAYSATTMIIRPHETKLVDGPFVSGEDVLGGYCVLDVADLDEAIGLAKTWPIPESRVEIRPIVER